jgi:hypothetical protein
VAFVQIRGVVRDLYSLSYHAKDMLKHKISSCLNPTEMNTPYCPEEMNPGCDWFTVSRSLMQIESATS